MWGQILGAAVSGAFAQKQAQKQMDFQAGQTAQQMAFQERMSSTAHQREVEDLRKAGLNPILSGTGGGGASSPAGASGSGAMTSIDPVNTGLAVARLKQELKNLKAQENKTKAETDVITFGAPARVLGTQVKDIIKPSNSAKDVINKENKAIQRRKEQLKNKKADWL